eukprot:3370348-Amphidinium_carterae.1
MDPVTGEGRGLQHFHLQAYMARTYKALDDIDSEKILQRDRDRLLTKLGGGTLACPSPQPASQNTWQPDPQQHSIDEMNDK